MFPDWMLAQMRARFNKNLIETCTIERYADSLDAYGNPEKMLASSHTSACFLNQLSQGAEAMTTGADVAKVMYELELPYDADIADGDSVLIGSERYQTVRVIRNESQAIRRQARLVKAGS